MEFVNFLINLELHLNHLYSAINYVVFNVSRTFIEWIVDYFESYALNGREKDLNILFKSYRIK
jgi:hypothetical protein